MILPFSAPIILSRKRYLSLGRWMILSLFFFIISAPCDGLAYMVGFYYVFALPSFAMLGCLLAAAFYPKLKERAS
jgi:hypothetical protein